MNFSKAHMLGFKLRMGIRKENHYVLRKPCCGLQLDPKLLGPKIDFLINCLDPDIKHTKGTKKKTFVDMDTRYIITEEISDLDRIEN